ncbi:Gfo/Idh/MocA family oxidoreductase, partial [Octadecabacter sp.]|nr:Gfo/Idh/MocA family oxidoreductase [Octadecabacter sp.]
EPVSVFAVGAALVDPAIGEAGDVDTAAVTLTTASGKICQISNSRRATYGYDQRIEVHGSGGMLRAANVLENTVDVANANGFQTAPTLNFFLERYEAAYAIEMQTFIAHLNDPSVAIPTIEDGLRAQIMADAAAKSLETGQPVAL